MKTAPEPARGRRVPAAGINLFQLIYTFQREYTRRTGLPPLNLSLGNPDTTPPEAILRLQSRFAADPTFELHTYAEDGNLRSFAERMVELHGGIRFREHEHLRAVPIPGIKGATTLIPLACGLHLSERRRFRIASNLPAYDVIGTWSQSYLGAERIVWPLVTEDDMRLNVDRLRRALRDARCERPDVVHVIRPGNPASVGAGAEEWKALIEFCLERGSRLVNDAAYAALAGPSHAPLASVAAGCPELEWIEMYSVSKSFSDPGARLGALVGSKEFVEDFVTIKGNTDSGPAPFLMAAYGAFFEDRQATEQALEALRGLYRRRVEYASGRLEAAGLRKACSSDSGFFTLWQVPKSVLGAELSTDARTRDLPAHEAFNRLVTDETGIVGVHFQSVGSDGKPAPLIRYAMCADVLDPAFQTRFEEQLGRLRPEY